MNCYSEEYLKRYDVVDSTFDTRKDPDAKKNRDKQSRELRKEGYTVQTTKYEFPDLGPGIVYTIHATREKRGVI